MHFKFYSNYNFITRIQLYEISYFKHNLIDTAFILKCFLYRAVKVITGQFKSQRDGVNLRNAPVK